MQERVKNVRKKCKKDKKDEKDEKDEKWQPKQSGDTKREFARMLARLMRKK